MKYTVEQYKGRFCLTVKDGKRVHVALYDSYIAAARVGRYLCKREKTSFFKREKTRLCNAYFVNN